MRPISLLAVALAGVLLAGVTAGATPLDKRTFFTFNGPIAIPGVTLPAGKYMFRIVETSSRNVIQVLSADGRKPYAMFFGRREQRADIPSAPEVSFMETAADMPRAVQTWWYPGERSGYEFVYPKKQARLLAKGLGRPVLTTVEETAAPPRAETPELTRIAPSGEELAVETPAPPAATIAKGELAPEEIQVPEPTATIAAAALPKTASPLPLAAAVALLLMVGAGFVRVWRLRLG